MTERLIDKLMKCNRALAWHYAEKDRLEELLELSRDDLMPGHMAYLLSPTEIEHELTAVHDRLDALRELHQAIVGVQQEEYAEQNR